MTDQKLNLSENPDNESYEGTWYHNQETLQQSENSKQKEDSTRIVQEPPSVYTNLLESKRLMYNVHLLMTKHYKLSLNSPTTSQ